MDFFILLLEITGTVAFAASGAMTGIKKRMDVFGVMILGLTTAIGGGVIRDLILGITPPKTFRNPTYAIIALAVSVIIFIPHVRRLLQRNPRAFESVLNLMDALGLGIFTTMGIKTALDVSSTGYNGFLLIFVGVVTGVGGGVMRDVLSGDTPYIFSRHIYASASVIGGVICYLLWPLLESMYSMLAGFSIIVVIRLLSTYFRWDLPRARDIDTESAAAHRRDG